MCLWVPFEAREEVRSLEARVMGERKPNFDPPEEQQVLLTAIPPALFFSVSIKPMVEKGSLEKSNEILSKSFS